MKRPAHWLRVQRHQPPTSFPAASAAPLAASEWGMQWRCFFWIACVCLFDATAPTMVVILGGSIVFELWALTRSAQPSQRMRAMWGRLYSPPPHLVFFAVMMLVNVAFQEHLTEAASRPHAANVFVMHAVILIWVYVCTPNSRIARESLHFWSSGFVVGLSFLLLIQLVAKQVFDVTVDFRELLTGEPARSGIEEGTSGLRPTSLFQEPSNHAIVIFLFTFIARLTGPRSVRLTAVSAFSCLLNNSGIGLILTAFLVLEEISYQAKVRRIGLPLLMGCAAVLILLLVALEASNYKLMAWERIVRPQTRYDPVAVRLFVPNAILHFEPIDHLLGNGISNYASFKDGVTLSDSTFVLGVYYQIGMLGLVMVLSTLRSAWLVHSPRAAVMLLMLFMTKMSLLSPTFWALTVLLVRGGAVNPVARNDRPLRLVTVRVMAEFTQRLSELLSRWGRIAKALVLITVLPSERAMPQTTGANVAVATPFQETQPAHFEHTFFAPDSHNEPFPRRLTRHARRPHSSRLARRGR